MNTITLDSHFSFNKKTIISFVYNVLKFSTTSSKHYNLEQHENFHFPTCQYCTINLVRRCPMHSVTGFVGQNERTSIKRSKRGASFVINRTAFCCCYTVTQFVNLQQDCSPAHRHNFQTTLFCLFLPYVIKPDAYDMLTCHPKNYISFTTY